MKNKRRNNLHDPELHSSFNSLLAARQPAVYKMLLPHSCSLTLLRLPAPVLHNELLRQNPQYSTVAATCRLLHTRASPWGHLHQTRVPSSARSRTRAAAQENNCSFSVFFSFVVISATSGVIDQCTVQDEADKSRPQSWPLQYGQPPAVVPACLVLHTINRGVPAITSQSKREIDLWVCPNRKIN